MATVFLGGSVLQAYVDPVSKFEFNRDLTIGSTGPDVQSLQVFLNRDPDTRLAILGAGSPGQETEYFGPITRNAIIRFQEKYADEILRPLNLWSGTGYFGPSTRAKIMSLLNTQATTPTTPVIPPDSEKKEEKSSETFGMYTDELMLTQPSHYYGEKGTTLNLYGFGFSSNNTIHFGDDFSIENIKAESHDTIKINVPDELGSGYYDLRVENEKGEGAESQAFFVVVDKGSVPPRIDSVSPERAKPGDTVVVYGEGFNRDWNMVRTTFFTAEGFSSVDGRVLTFKIPHSFFEETDLDPDHINMDNLPDEPTPTPTGDDRWEFETYIYVVNVGGISMDPGSFILELNL